MTAPAMHRDRRGSVTVETALVLSLFLLPLVYGVAAIGQAVSTQVRLDRALHAAMLYIWATPGAAASGIQNAATSGYGAGDPTMTPTASKSCACIQPTAARPAGASGAHCSDTCANGTVLASYMTISLNATVAVDLPLPANLQSQALTASGTVRVQ